MRTNVVFFSDISPILLKIPGIRAQKNCKPCSRRGQGLLNILGIVPAGDGGSGSFLMLSPAGKVVTEVF